MNTDIIVQYFEEFLADRKSLELVSYQLFEEPGTSKIEISVKDGDSISTVTGTGVGMIDAGFNSLVDHYSAEFASLDTVTLEDVYFQIDHKAQRDVSFKSQMEIKLEFSNHCKDRTWFSGRTKSLGYTGVSVLVSAIEFYINCELLFRRVKFLFDDAEKRKRPDVASKYKYVLSKVVEVTNYQTIA
tara:strand:- start:17018 stop:17575 length:558 start_codon:yes stop_codon:yes gene_type:complete